MTLEEKLAFVHFPTAPAEDIFIVHMRAAARNGVGYGWMQQVIEWEWQARQDHISWGPESHQRDIADLIVALGDLLALNTCPETLAIIERARAVHSKYF